MEKQLLVEIYENSILCLPDKIFSMSLIMDEY